MKTAPQIQINKSVGTILHCRSKAYILALFLPALMLLPASVQSATTWNNAVTSGDWTTAGNWSNAVPSNTNTTSIINSTSSAISITGASGVWTDSAGYLIFQNTGTGSTALQLGGNLTWTAASGNFTNTLVSTPSALVLDLNGHTFAATSASATGVTQARNYSITNSSIADTGYFIVNSIGRNSSRPAGSVEVGSNIVVKLNSRAQMDFRPQDGGTGVGWNFATGSTLLLSGDGSLGSPSTNMNTGAGSVFANVQVGEVGVTTNAINYNINQSTTVKGNLTYVNGSLFNFTATGSQQLLVGGNFTDLATTGLDYGNTAVTDGVYFNGGGSTVQEVNIARTGLTAQFSVGNNSTTTAGSVLLKHDLATTNKVTVTANSTLDVGQYTVTAGTLLISTGATMGSTFGTLDSGLLAATGALTLNSFNLNLTYDGLGWTNGADLRLFTYGSLTGTPALAAITLPGGWSYTSLWNDTSNKTIWLTGLSSVPEPSTLCMLLGTAVLVLGLRARRARKSP